jgi:hypothetical protein
MFIFMTFHDPYNSLNTQIRCAFKDSSLYAEHHFANELDLLTRHGRVLIGELPVIVRLNERFTRALPSRSGTTELALTGCKEKQQIINQTAQAALSPLIQQCL